MTGSGRANGGGAAPSVPASTAELVERGVRLCGLGDHAAGIECFRAAVRMDARCAAACFNLGNALMALGRKADPCAAYRDAVDIEQDARHARHSPRTRDWATGASAPRGATF